MMKGILGVAGAALVGVAFAAYADDYGTSGTGGSGTTMQKDTMPNDTGSMKSDTTGAMGKNYDTLSNELTGRVVKADPSMVYVEHMGAVVPLKLDKNTRFEGSAIKRAKDLKEGQEIRASFTVQNRTDNLAKSISLSSATGGSGFNDINTGSQMNKDVNKDLNQPVDQGTTPNKPSDQSQKY